MMTHESRHEHLDTFTSARMLLKFKVIGQSSRSQDRIFRYFTTATRLSCY